jgi:hypothetical protein
MKFSRVISRVRCFSLVETNVSKTIYVLVLRVVEIIWVRSTTQSFYLYLSKLRSQGCLLATGGFPIRSLLSLPGSAFWLASILVIGNQAQLRLKPLSLLKFSLFSLMWMASFMITILDRTSGYMDRIVKEVIHMRLNKKNFNRDNGFNLSRAWFPITRMLAS